MGNKANTLFWLNCSMTDLTECDIATVLETHYGTVVTVCAFGYHDEAGQQKAKNGFIEFKEESSARMLLDDTVSWTQPGGKPCQVLPCFKDSGVVLAFKPDGATKSEEVATPSSTPVSASAHPIDMPVDCPDAVPSCLPAAVDVEESLNPHPVSEVPNLRQESEFLPQTSSSISSTADDPEELANNEGRDVSMDTISTELAALAQTETEAVEESTTHHHTSTAAEIHPPPPTTAAATHPPGLLKGSPSLVLVDVAL